MRSQVAPLSAERYTPVNEPASHRLGLFGGLRQRANGFVR